jgi:predicted Zn-dependent peptidase
LKNIQDVETQLIDLLNEIKKDGFTEEEVNSAKMIYKKMIIDESVGNSRIAKSFSELRLLNLDFDYFDKLLARIDKLSVEEINRIISSYFSDLDFVRVRVGRVHE